MKTSIKTTISEYVNLQTYTTGNYEQQKPTKQNHSKLPLHVIANCKEENYNA